MGSRVRLQAAGTVVCERSTGPLRNRHDLSTRHGFSFGARSDIAVYGLTDSNECQGLSIVTTNSYEFTVDARLLRELGERLVGRPHIALAELVKNSYDADARSVEIAFDPGRIVVTDDGHGMSEDDFVHKWMRVGTTHKEQSRHSPGLGRAMTGSKGVGRLAVQLLARHTRITSVALSLPTMNRVPAARRDRVALDDQIDAQVDWDSAVESGDLTAVTIPVAVGPRDQEFAGGSQHGTRVELTRLVHRWDATRFRRLAQEIWSLQPPFEVADDDPNAFKIIFTTGFRQTYELFDQQMRALLDIWSARVTGQLRPLDHVAELQDQLEAVFDLPRRLPSRLQEDPIEAEDAGAVHDVGGDPSPTADTVTTEIRARPTRYLDFTVELRDGAVRRVKLRVPECEVDRMEFDLRVFDLQHRQPQNIKVGQARDYLERFGGVGIYDGGFRLPYYGAEQDWLDIERAHAARLSASQLLPESLKVDRGLQDLPTNRRLFGQVWISTSHEAAVHETGGKTDPDALAIQVTRDRLLDNAAYERLRVMIRAALDAYAMEQARSRLNKAKGKRLGSGRPPSSSFTEVRRAIQDAKPQLPDTTYRDLDRAVSQAVKEAEVLEEISREHAALLGALATAGMTSLAYEHEISREIAAIRSLVSDLEAVLDDLVDPARATVMAAVGEMRDWVVRARGIRKMLSPLMDQETRMARGRFLVKTVASTVAEQVRSLSRGIPIYTERIPPKLRLPSGAFPAWSAVFQNLYINSFNALIKTSDPRIEVDAGGDDRRGWVKVQDNGIGVDLDDADRLWEPFERRNPLPPEAAALGLGGSGLGLTIVRMIADELRANVSFARPDADYSTAVTISWEGHR